MNNNDNTLKDLANAVLTRAFAEQPSYKENGILCHPLANKQFFSSNFNFTLRQWILISNGISLKKHRKLYSKEKLKNSIDINDLYYKI
jgi:hypothetical protein